MSVTSNREGDYIKSVSSDIVETAKLETKFFNFSWDMKLLKMFRELRCCVRQYKSSWKFMTISVAYQA